MKNIVYKILFIVFITLMGFNISAQEKSQNQVIILKNDGTSSSDLNKSTLVVKTLYATPKATDVVIYQSKESNTNEPVYIANGVAIKDLNDLDPATILNITVDGNTILITTTTKTASVLNSEANVLAFN